MKRFYRQGFPESFRLEAILSLGIPEAEAKAHQLGKLLTEKIHRKKFQESGEEWRNHFLPCKHPSDLILKVTELKK
ncbi:MAG: hypothetical protein QM657_15415 [Lacrimispora sp.]|uniref:hypothetical protein n=1 Tax=Lacrimispora sp. TaxID=2719234 RepID=UPI0039E39AEC